MLMIKFTEVACPKVKHEFTWKRENDLNTCTKIRVMLFCFSRKTVISKSEGTIDFQVVTLGMITCNIIWWYFMCSEMRFLISYPRQWPQNLRESNIVEFVHVMTTFIIIIIIIFFQWPTSDLGFNDVFEWKFPVFVQVFLTAWNRGTKPYPFVCSQSKHDNVQFNWGEANHQLSYGWIVSSFLGVN
jgi:hypothetical protein